jgi:23S rRNA pseudouridine1911/1915/1917 synthase
MKQDQAPQVRELQSQADGIRLDKYLASTQDDLTRSHIRKLIDEGHVMLNGKPARAAAILKQGDRIALSLAPAGQVELIPEDIDFEVIYQDALLAVINKPAGLTVYPAPGHAGHTLANALVKRFPALAAFGSSLRPGIVHRLDKDTSGLMVVAMDDGTRLYLTEQFKSRKVVKKYLALARGRLAPASGAIDAPIGRDPSDRKRMAVVSRGRPARTEYKVLEYLEAFTLLEVRISTGRTHQIRVHLSAIGHPIAGDFVYGTPSAVPPRQFLHACYLEFCLPGSAQPSVFTCPLPDDLRLALQTLKGGGR